jgi:branched-chain amino acid transport system substrate-binding protein
MSRKLMAALTSSLVLVAAFLAASLPYAAESGDETILVGEYGSFTGSEATFGQSTHAGVLLAVQELNATGGINGKKVKIKNYDDKGDAQEAANCVLRLATEDKVVAVLGEVASSLSKAGGQVAQTNGVPMISPSSTNAEVTKIGDMIFRVCFIDDFQGYVGAKFAVENLKAMKVAVLYDQKQAYSTGLKDDFGKALKAMKGTVTTEQAYSGGDTDFNAQLTAIRDTKPDAIYVPGYYTEVGNIAVQARKLGIKVPLIGGDGWDSPKLAEIGGAAINGSYYSNHYSEEDVRPEVQAFVKKFKAKNPTIPADGLAALGYDAARLLFDAMKRAASLSGKDLAAAIAATKGFKGVTGIITIDKDRNAEKSAVMLEMKDGKPRYLATIEPPK